MHCCDQVDAFSEVFARKGNIVTGIEARTKLGFTVVALAINLISPGIYTSLGLAVFSLVTLLLIQVPARLLLLRLAMPLVMAGVLLLTQVFFSGRTPLFTISLWGLSLTGYHEGLTRGLVVVCRALGGASLVLLLSMSTSVDKLFMAAAWYRMPKTFIELALLVYRYIFVLIEEHTVMKDAHRVRLGFRSWRQSMRSFSTLGACLILRAYDRAERVFEAMTLRGYAGASVNCRTVFNRRDGLTAVSLALLLAGFYFVGRTLA